MPKKLTVLIEKKILTWSRSMKYLYLLNEGSMEVLSWW